MQIHVYLHFESQKNIYRQWGNTKLILMTPDNILRSYDAKLFVAIYALFCLFVLVFPVTKETSLQELLCLLSSKVTLTVNQSFSKSSFQSNFNFQSTWVNRSEVSINEWSSDFACEESLIFVCFTFFSEQPEVFSSFLLFFLFLSLSFRSLLAQGSVLNEIESDSLCRMGFLCFSAGSWENSLLVLQKSVGRAGNLQIQKMNK